MYNEHFGLRETPFSIAPDPRYLFMSEGHREALAHLLYGIQGDGGFVLLTGEVGTGKTTVCRCLLEQLPEGTEVAYVVNPKLSAHELLATVCDEFRIPYPEGTASIKTLVDRLNAHLLEAHARGRTCVLIIDEAQNLEADVLEQLRLLTNLETDRRKLLQILLLGQPELRDLLARPQLRQLAQRITARYHLKALNRKEVASYVSHRLAVAGLRRRLFQKNALEYLAGLSGGIPRLINLICDRALLGAYSRGESVVTRSLLRRAGIEVFGPSRPGDNGSPRYRNQLLSGLAAFLLALILAAGARIWDESDPVSASPIPAEAAAQESPPIIEKFPFATERDRELAFQSLFTAWGVSYNPERDGLPCVFAPSAGLRCLEKRGNMGSLRRLNRPAVLRLSDEDGQEHFAALTALDGETATAALSCGTLSVEISLQELENVWIGDFILLGRIPSESPHNLRPGDKGPGVQWLAAQLSALKGKGAAIKDPVLKGELLDDLRAFQASQGLNPDGIAGPQTVLHLNSAVSAEGPRLLRGKGD